MTDDLVTRCELLADAWRWWAEMLEGLDEDDWVRPTRLEGWDVAALVAHHSLLVGGITVLASHPVDAAPATLTARDMLRRFNEPAGIANTAADGVAELARQQAATSSNDDLVARFLHDAPAAVAAVRDGGPTVIEYFGQGTFPISEAAAIAIMEAVVHGLDLCDAIGAGAYELPGDAARFTTELLASLPETVDFIDAATGRRPADVLPVLR